MASTGQNSTSIHNTKDGSHTVYSTAFGQFYHNPNGAIEESKHVFFKTSGLLDDLKSTTSLTVFEVGFGTGLNLLLLAEYISKFGISFPVSFYTVEAFPISTGLVTSLNYFDKIKGPIDQESLKNVFGSLKTGLNTFPDISGSGIDLHVFQGDFLAFEQRTLQADFIFHDPFSPEVNEGLWTPSTFSALKELGHKNTVLATYCAASKARAAMAKAGWSVARAKGALGKREMTVASISESKLDGLKLVNSEKLIERFDNGDFD